MLHRTIPDDTAGECACSRWSGLCKQSARPNELLSKWAYKVGWQSSSWSPRILMENWFSFFGLADVSNTDFQAWKTKTLNHFDLLLRIYLHRLLILRTHHSNQNGLRCRRPVGLVAATRRLIKFIICYLFTVLRGYFQFVMALKSQFWRMSSGRSAPKAQAALWTMKPGHELRWFVHFHFRALKLVQFLSYVGLVLWSQKAPRLVRLTIVVVCLGYLNVVAKLDNFSLLQVLYCRPKA